MAGRVGPDPGGGSGGGREQAAVVEVGRVAGVARPFGRGVVQPGAVDPVGVRLDQPRVTEQRPGAQQHLVTDLDGVGGEGEQAFGGEGLDHGRHVPRLRGVLGRGQFGSCRPVGTVSPVAAGGGQPGEDLPGADPLGGGQGVIGTLRAVGDGTFDAAHPFVVGEGKGVAGPVRQAWSRACDSSGSTPAPQAGGWPARQLPQQRLHQRVIDAGTRRRGLLGDGHPQLPLGHRRHEVAVLDRGRPAAVLAQRASKSARTARRPAPRAAGAGRWRQRGVR